MPDYLHYSIAQIATRPANEKGSPSIHLKKKTKNNPITPLNSQCLVLCFEFPSGKHQTHSLMMV